MRRTLSMSILGLLLRPNIVVAGFSFTTLDVTQLGQRQGRVASLLLARGARGWSS